MGSPVTSRSNWANDSSTLSVSCLLVVVLNVWLSLHQAHRRCPRSRPDCGQQIVLRKLGSLKPATKRVRKTSAVQIERVMTSIKQSGFAGAILIRSDQVVDGHARMAAMCKLGETQIPCIDVGHLNNDDCRLLTISMNRIAETGEWDLSVLREEICELDALTCGHRLFGAGTRHNSA
jgi:hypothetical protein